MQAAGDSSPCQNRQQF